MNQYTFAAIHRNVLLGAIGLGIVCMILTWFGDTDAYHTRFWTNFLHNSVYFTMISVMALFLLRLASPLMLDGTPHLKGFGKLIPCFYL